MSGHEGLAESLPVVAFLHAVSRKRDAVAVCLVGAILVFSSFILLLPVSRTVQAAAARRFQLVGWPFAVWAVFQPLPSMYNFENRWQVTFTPHEGAVADEACQREFRGFINHHIFNRVLLQRVALERCGLPAHVRFQTVYRGLTITNEYLLTAGPGLHGFVVTPQSQ